MAHGSFLPFTSDPSSYLSAFLLGHDVFTCTKLACVALISHHGASMREQHMISMTPQQIGRRGSSHTRFNHETIKRNRLDTLQVLCRFQRASIDAWENEPEPS